MYRISVTTLEKFRRYMAETSAYDTEDALIASLQGVFTGNDKTRTGSAYHKILEGEYEIDNNLVVVKCDKDVFAFTAEQAKPGIDYHNAHPSMTQEMNVSKIYSTVYGEVTVTGRVDGIEALIVRDGKTKYRAVDANEYRESCQWKFYLDMLEAKRFFFDVFEFKGFKDLTSHTPIMLKDVVVIPHDPIECVPYEDMNKEIKTLLNDFLHYIDNRNFWRLLKPAQEEPELNF